MSTPNESDAVDVDEIDNLVETLELEAAAMQVSANTSALAPAPAAEPHRESKLHALTRHVYNLATPDAEGHLTGMQLRPLMMMSKVATASLAEVWNAVDTGRVGKASDYVYA